MRSTMIEQGAAAPSVSLPGTEGEEIEDYDLGDYTDSGVVVLVFYPFDFSPVCVDELCDFRDSGLLTLTENVDVFGISTDSAYAHRAFSTELDLVFPLLSDSNGEAIEKYDVRYEELEGHTGVSKRAVVIVDASTTVRYVWVSDDAYDSPDIADVFEEVKTVLREQGEWQEEGDFGSDS